MDRSWTSSLHHVRAGIVHLANNVEEERFDVVVTVKVMMRRAGREEQEERQVDGHELRRASGGRGVRVWAVVSVSVSDALGRLARVAAHSVLWSRKSLASRHKFSQ